jgi:hypothetical protein
MLLLRHEDDAEAAFPDLLQELVRADHRARAFRDRRLINGDSRDSRRLEEVASVFLGVQEALDATAHLYVRAARLIQEGDARLGGLLLQGSDENRLDP